MIKPLSGNPLSLARYARATHLALLITPLSSLVACATATPPDSVTIYASRPLPSWHVTIADFQATQELTGSSAIVPKPAHTAAPDVQVDAHVSGKTSTDDALTLHWKDTWYAGLKVEGGPPMDLRPYVADGTLDFDLDVVDMAHGGLAFKVVCRGDCDRKVSWVLPARAAIGRGWQHLSFPLRCFVRDNDDFSAVTQPFGLETGGTGEVAVANVMFKRHGTPNAVCPDYRTESVTPAILNESWSIDWWLPRHQQKLDQIRKLRETHTHSDLIFIGDSITEGWEKSGQPVWDRHYAKYNALDLGFGGDQTENVLWRLQHGELDGISPRVAVLMLGTNNTGHRQEDPTTTAAGIHRVIDEIRQRLPDTRILLLAVFPRDQLPDSALRRRNERINTIISAFADDQKIFFLNINPFLTNADGSLSRDVMPDLLHPNEKGYDIWASHMEPTLLKLLSLP